MGKSRVSVPAVGAGLRVGPTPDVECFALSVPTVSHTGEIAPLQPLEGIQWPFGGGVPSSARAGQVALFDVVDPGELQEWGRRGDG